jgi:hypothetical protein
MKYMVLISLVVLCPFAALGLDYAFGLGLSSVDSMALADIGYEEVSTTGVGLNFNF